MSDSPEKQPIPGEKAVWRLYDRREVASVDVIALPDEVPGDGGVFHHPHRSGLSRELQPAAIAGSERLLDTTWEGGRIWGRQTIEAARAIRNADLSVLDPGVRRIVDPHVYHVSVTSRMRNLQERVRKQTLAGA